MALPPVIIRFMADGVPDVSRAFRTIADVAANGNRLHTGAARRGSSERVQLAQAEANEHVRAYERAQRGEDAARRVGNREAERAARADVRRAAQAASEKLRIAERLSATERRLRGEALRDTLSARGAHAPSPTSAAARLAVLGRAKSGSVADQRAALEHVAELGGTHRAQTAGKRAQLRAAQSLDREERKLRDASVRDAERAEASKARTAERVRRAQVNATYRYEREMQARAEEAAAKRERVLRTVGGNAVRLARAGVGAATAVAGGIAQIGGGFSVTDAVQRRVTLRGQLADIANRGIIADDPENAKRRSVDELQAKTNAVGARFAIAPERVASGLDKFGSKTGHLTRGLELMDGLAEMSRAGAGELDDLADAAGDVFNADKTQNAKQVLGVMRALAAQGKLGAVDMKDLASQMAKLGAAAGQFQGDAGKNMAFMGGLAQMARESGGAAGPAQATTAVQALTTQFYKGARLKGFAELGVQTKDEKTGFNRDLDAIIVETFKGTEKASRKRGHGMRDFDQILTKAFADKNALVAINPLKKAYKEAGGGEAGEKAVQALFKKFGEATMSEAEVRAAAAERMKETDAQLEIAMQKLRSTTADQLTPTLVSLVPKIQELVPLLGQFIQNVVKMVEWTSKNPFEGLGLLVGGFITKELATAAIGDAIKRAIAGGGAPGAGGVPGATGGAPGGDPNGALGAIGIGAIATGQAYVAGKTVDSYLDARKRGEDRARVLSADLQAGGERGEAAKREVAKAQESGSAATIAKSDYVLRMARNAVAPQTAIADAVVASLAQKLGLGNATESSERAVANDALVEQMKRNNDELAKNTEATRQNSQNQGAAGSAGPQLPPPIGSAPVSGGRGPTGS